MYEHVKTGCKHIPPSEQPLQFQSGYFLNKPRIRSVLSLESSITLLCDENIFCNQESVAEAHTFYHP